MPVPLVRSHADSAVLIAGGTSGVGLATAVAFTDAGVRRIALLGRNPDRGAAARQQVADHCPDARVEFLPCDAGELTQVVDAVGSAHELLDGLDVLVSSTTTAYRPDLLHRTDPADLERILVGQAVPPMLLTRVVLPYLQEQGGGSIVNIASDAAKVPTPGEAALGAAMAAIVVFSRVAALEAKRDGVRVNVLTPSLIAGTATAANVLRDGFSRKLFEKAAGQAHLGVAEPADLAAMAVFLGGPAAARVTGQAISVNGGVSIA
ncbi:SDR family NAD(P)-dependent oxidoreductase [Nocardioides humi]|uniref:SDR family oxidoreductase n=1 Tax=Nocardioides humi TaxID=449461 RepID=A0ABN2AYD6_9ACTN|nr:SDR family oxidoreductase [Nocardioides humi]